MEKVYNKLVRDNIPSIIENDNEIPCTRILNDDEFKNALYDKLVEECHEAISSNSSEEIIKELSDIVEVIKSIAELNNSSIEKVIEVANLKREERGGFSKRIFLEKSIKKNL